MILKEGAKMDAHKLILDSRKKLSVTGVTEVIGFDDTIVNLSVGEVALTVTGKSLTITKLSVAGKESGDGEVVIEGNVDAMVYSDRSHAKKGFRFFS